MKLFSKLLLALFLLTLSAISEASWNLKADLQQDMEKKTWFLNLTLTNNSLNSVDTFKSSLPWATLEQLDMIAIPLVTHALPLQQAIYIDDPKFDPFTITPNQVLKGQINLGERFPDLKNYNRREPIVICYRFQFAKIEKGNGEFADGCLLIHHDQK